VCTDLFDARLGLGLWILELRVISALLSAIVWHRPPPRNAHQAVFHKKYLYVFGGEVCSISGVSRTALLKADRVYGCQIGMHCPILRRRVCSVSGVSRRACVAVRH
jgi:hypothetical protein